MRIVNLALFSAALLASSPRRPAWPRTSRVTSTSAADRPSSWVISASGSRPAGVQRSASRSTSTSVSASSSSTPIGGSAFRTRPTSSRGDFRRTTRPIELSFNMIANLTQPDSPVRFYVAAGPGMYNRKVEITEYARQRRDLRSVLLRLRHLPGRGGGRLARRLGLRLQRRRAASASASATRVSSSSRSKYHYVWGPEIVAATPLPAGQGTGGSTTGQDMPLTFGFRF